MVKVQVFLENNAGGDWLTFGKFMLNKKFLKQNILLMKYKNSYAPIPWLRRTTIDEIFKDFWLELVATGTISYGLLKQCSNSQIDMVERIVDKANMTDELKFDKANAIMNTKDVAERLEILQGEIEAGNNNEKIVIEAKNVIHKLYLLKKIDMTTRDELLQEF